MVCISVDEKVGGLLHRGDVVFDWDPEDQEYPLHAGIYVGEEVIEATSASPLEVISLPHLPEDTAARLGVATWNKEKSYRLKIIGHREDAEEIELRGLVSLIERLYVDVDHVGSAAQQQEPAWQMLRPVLWRRSRKMDYVNGEQIFMAGTCSQFVEYIYEQSDLDLVNQAQTFNPLDPARIYPATQIRAFALDRYPLVEQPWREALSRYPDCLDPLPPPP